MEKQLFDWEGWDQTNTLDFQYYNVKLKISIGNYSPGKEFAIASLSYETGVLIFYNVANDEVDRFKLELKVVDA